MAKSKISLPKGKVKMYIIDDKGKTLVYDDPNTVVANAKEILAHVLGGDNGYALDTIHVSISSSIVASDTSLQVSYPGINVVQFDAVFNEASFNGVVDEIFLESSGGGQFATIGGLVVAKTATQKLGITWEIEFSDCI